MDETDNRNIHYSRFVYLSRLTYAIEQLGDVGYILIESKLLHVLRITVKIKTFQYFEKLPACGCGLAV